MAHDVLGGDVGDDFDLPGVLADGAQGDGFAGVEGAVGDVDVGAVLFHRDGVVAVGDGPAEEGDVVCVGWWVGSVGTRG